MAGLRELYLQHNQIGDKGLEAFSKALATGAMVSLEFLGVDGGPLGTEHPALRAACSARGIELVS